MNKLKTVDQSEIQKSKLNKPAMSSATEIKITAQAASLNQQLHARQKAFKMQKETKRRKDSDSDSDSEDGDWTDSD